MGVPLPTDTAPPKGPKSPRDTKPEWDEPAAGLGSSMQEPQGFEGGVEETWRESAPQLSLLLSRP